MGLALGVLVLIVGGACATAPLDERATSSTLATAPGATTTSDSSVTDADSGAVVSIGDGVAIAVRAFYRCLDDAAVAYVGGPDPDLGDTAPQNDPTYVGALSTCAAVSSIVDALSAAEAEQVGLDVDGIERENFGYLAWRDCVADRGIDIPVTEPDDRGLLVSYALGEPSSSIGSDLSMNVVLGCMDQTTARHRTATCVDRAPDATERAWSIDYSATLGVDGFELSELVSGSDAGEWTFVADGSSEPVTARPDADGLFDLVLESRQAIAHPPGGACALVLNALGGYGLPQVALVGDSNIVAVDNDLLDPEAFGARVRSWNVVGESGGTWLVDPVISSSGVLDELRGVVADEPDAVVIGLGVNDALLLSLASTPQQQAQLRDRTQAAVDTGLAILDDTRCLVLTGATEAPTSILGAGDGYAAAAVDINQLLARAIADRPGAVLTDWPDESAPHHLSDGSPGDWFVDGDEIHLTPDGRRAYVEHVRAALDRSCGTGVA